MEYIIHTVTVQSSPSNAKIYINGVDTGRFARWTFNSMTPGNYDVYVLLEGYTTPVGEKVTVIGGQTASLHFKLKKLK
ncbi:MAG: PEGA domain-containing protein [Methanoregula sp.]|nr:PEGA domain-containing protein [Methanoregula sp.]